MSATKPIPLKMREEMADDIFYKKCCIKDNSCDGRIEWHHHLKFASKRVNEKWAILPLCHHHHVHEAEYRDILDGVMVSRATDEELKPYCKVIDYRTKRR